LVVVISNLRAIPHNCPTTDNGIIIIIIDKNIMITKISSETLVVLVFGLWIVAGLCIDNAHALRCYTDAEATQITRCKESEGFRTCFTKYNDSKAWEGIGKTFLYHRHPTENNHVCYISKIWQSKILFLVNLNCPAAVWFYHIIVQKTRRIKNIRKMQIAPLHNIGSIFLVIVFCFVKYIYYFRWKGGKYGYKQSCRQRGRKISFIHCIGKFREGVFDSRTSCMVNLDQERVCKYF